MHHLQQPFALDRRDSGSRQAPILYETHPRDVARGRFARLSGGIRVPRASFRRARRSGGLRSIVTADLLRLGLNATSFGGYEPPPLGDERVGPRLELYVAGEPMTVARDPNLAPDAEATWRWIGYENVTMLDNRTLTLADAGTGAKWRRALRHNRATGDHAGLWLHIYARYDWHDEYLRLTAIKPTRERSKRPGPYRNFTLHLEPRMMPKYQLVSGCRFYAVDALRLLDSPGEYYVARKTGVLHFWPPSDEALDNVFVSVQDSVLRSHGADYVTFANLRFEHARLSAVELHGRHVKLVNSTVQGAGGHCVVLGGKHSRIDGCVIRSCGRCGVWVNGGNRTTLEHSHNAVRRNRISHFSRITRTFSPGIRFNRTVGIHVEHNTIAHGPHNAISGSGNDNLFERNVISNVAFETTDVGAFYAMRSWAQRGNIVRFNLFDTVRATQRLAQHKPFGQVAFYLDDMMSGWEFYGNTIRNASTGVKIAGGRDNHVRSNLFVDCDRDVSFDARGLNWSRHRCEDKCSGRSCLRTELEELHHLAAPWVRRYPILVDLLDQHPCRPVGNVIADNRFCHARSTSGARVAFVDQTQEQIRLWLSTLSNNIEDCSGRGLPTPGAGVGDENATMLSQESLEHSERLRYRSALGTAGWQAHEAQMLSTLRLEGDSVASLLTEPPRARVLLWETTERKFAMHERRWRVAVWSLSWTAALLGAVVVAQWWWRR